MQGKINISIGSPIKRLMDGVIAWREERSFKAWVKLMKAVKKHKRLHRKFLARQKRLERLEFEEWRHQQEGVLKKPREIRN